MKRIVKKYGNTHVVVLNKEFLKIEGIKVGDVVEVKKCKDQQ